MFSQNTISKKCRNCTGAILAILWMGVITNAVASSATDGVNMPCNENSTAVPAVAPTGVPAGVTHLTGETWVCNAQNVYQYTRLSSRGKDQGTAGDQLRLEGVPPALLISAYVPILNQTASRLGNTSSLAQNMASALSEATGLGYYTTGQSHVGTVTFIAGQTTLTFLPVGDIVIDTARSNGLRYLDDGRAEITVNGLKITLVSMPIPVTDLMSQLSAIDPQARLELTAFGWVKATVNSTVYAVWPGFFANSLTGVAGATKLDYKSDNLFHLTFPSSIQQVQTPAFSGMEQILFPSFDDLSALTETFKPYDAAVRVGTRMDGSYTAIFQGSLFRLTPSYNLTFPVPAEHQRDLWWTSNNTYYFKNRDGSSQGFSLTAIPQNDMNLTSFGINGNVIPAKYTCHGANTSIPLAWSGAPQYTQSFAVIMDDPDVTGSPFVHWNVFNIRPWVNGIAEGASRSFMPAGATEGNNDYGTSGYSGPCPPTRHRYNIKVFALKNLITVPAGPMTINEFELAYGTDIIASSFIPADYAP